MKWNKESNTESSEWCKFVHKIRPKFTENASTMEIFEELTGLDEPIEMIVTQYNLYTQQNARIFQVDTKEMRFSWHKLHNDQKKLQNNSNKLQNGQPASAALELIHLSDIQEFKTPWFEIVLCKFSKTFILLTTLGMIKLTVHSK